MKRRGKAWMLAALLGASLCGCASAGSGEEAAAAVQTTAAPVETEPAADPLVLVSQYVNDYDFWGNRVFYYDEAGHVVREEWPDFEMVLEYTYRENGTLESEHRYFATGETERLVKYDAMGNPVEEWMPDASGELALNKFYTNRYDDLGRPVEQSWEYAGEAYGETVLYSYNEDGSWTCDCTDYYYKDSGVREDQDHQVTTYDAEGNLLLFFQDLEYCAQVEYRTEYIYMMPGLLRESRMENHYQGWSESRTYGYRYTFGEGDQPIEMVRDYSYRCEGTDGTVEEESRISEWVIRYTYDETGRKIREERGDLEGEWTWVLTWEYDEYGNLIRRTEEDRVIEENVYAPLSEAIWKE